MLQIISLFAGLLTGVIKDIVTQSMKVREQQHRALMEKAGVIINDKQHARGIKFQFARRTIVLAFMFILIAPVIMLFIHPDMVFNVPIPQKGDGGFSFLFGLFSFGGGDSVHYIKVTGYVYIYTVLELLAPIVGYYFGSNGTQ